MISRLEADGISIVRHLFCTPNLRLFVDSAVLGFTPARVWVDRETHPRTAMAWDKGRSCYIVGDFENAQVNRELNEVFSREVAREGLARKPGYFKIYYFPEGWSDRIEAVFGGVKEKRVSRRIYTSVNRAVPGQPPIPDGFVLRQIDSALLGCDLARVDAVRKEILGGWPSVETFLEQGYGFTLVDEGSIVCWCTAEYVSAKKCGVGIETVEEYEGRGFATAVGSAFVHRALSMGLAPYWDCWTSNKGSIRVAEKIGFENPHTYQVGVGEFPQ